MKTTKKMLAILLTLVIAFATMPMAFADNLSEVPEGYIEIYTVEDLYCIRYDLTANYILMNDIDLNKDTAEDGNWSFGGRGWNPIGSNDVYGATDFSGVFDGNNHNITGMRISLDSVPSGTSTIHLGLFSRLSGTIKNLTVEGSISSTYDINYAGGIVASCTSTGVIENCTNMVKISVRCDGGYARIGGLIGSSNGTISKCRNLADISTGGYNSYNSYNHYVGGIVGDLRYPANIVYCYNSGDVQSSTSARVSNQVSGIATVRSSSSTQKPTIQYCYNYGDITSSSSSSSSSSHAAGIAYCECFYVDVADCYDVGVITGKSSQYAISNLSVTDCFYLGGTGSDCTGATSLTAVQMKLQRLYANWDFDSIWTMDGREDYPYPELREVPHLSATDTIEIGGSVAIIGNMIAGATLSADLNNITPEDVTLAYEWKINGETVSTDSIYVVQKRDSGYDVTLSVTGTGLYQGTIVSEPVTIDSTTGGSSECRHKYSNSWTIDLEPTCNSEGRKSHHCNYCTEKKDVTVIDKLPHSFGDWSITKEATCQEAGAKTRSCSCGVTETEEIAVIQHVMTVEDAVDATCTTAGKTAKVYCSLCGMIVLDSKAVDPWGHAVVIDPSIPATCTETGLTEGKHCSVCQAVLKAQEVVSATGHTEKTVDAVPATCTEDGLTESKICETCGENLVAQEVVKALGHSFVTETIAPTCTEKGYDQLTCKVCDFVETANEVNAVGHIDEDSNAICDICAAVLDSGPTTPDKPQDPSITCTCNCHTSGIVKFFFNIVLFFQRIFGSNQVCACGAMHY